jgi:hypothetical protein
MSRFLYGPRGPSFGASASGSAITSSIDQSLSVSPAAIAGVVRSVLCSLRVSRVNRRNEPRFVARRVL